MSGVCITKEYCSMYSENVYRPLFGVLLFCHVTNSFKTLLLGDGTQASRCFG
jgi:hypothetical protein